MELLTGLGVIIVIIVSVAKLLQTGFRREEARRAAMFAAVDTVIAGQESRQHENVVIMDANLLLNGHLSDPVDNKTLDLAHREYKRLFAEEYDYLLAQALVTQQLNRSFQRGV